ncbi:LOW QUALITY PROTEIN: hypothetical protein Dda_6566 [Drechslerella dactyloides]|uniref:Uncharacterized protein n=1 Tax=Drechslerella dactyloides TaxID=74499 RepID=A0AAD6IY15_DREDA|nr:LOW QUALITY PROTEIN: hypothetical protein Dda_6566 [Drechslerella dactyloides]
MSQLCYKRLYAGSYETDDTAVCRYPQMEQPDPIVLGIHTDSRGDPCIKISFTNWTEKRCELLISIQKVLLNMLSENVVYIQNLQKDNPASHWTLKVAQEDGGWHYVDTVIGSDVQVHGMMETPPRIISRKPINLMDVVNQFIILRECTNTVQEQYEFFTQICSLGSLMVQAHLGWPAPSSDSSTVDNTPAVPPPPPPPRPLPTQMLDVSPPRSNIRQAPPSTPVRSGAASSLGTPGSTSSSAGYPENRGSPAIGTATDLEVAVVEGGSSTDTIDPLTPLVTTGTLWKWISTALEVALSARARHEASTQADFIQGATRPHDTEEVLGHENKVEAADRPPPRDASTTSTVTTGQALRLATAQTQVSRYRNGNGNGYANSPSDGYDRQPRSSPEYARTHIHYDGSSSPHEPKTAPSDYRTPLPSRELPKIDSLQIKPKSPFCDEHNYKLVPFPLYNSEAAPFMSTFSNGAAPYHSDSYATADSGWKNRRRQ